MTAFWSRINTLLLILVLLALLGIIGMLATGIRGGPLDPPGPPASSYKTLDDTLGSWHRVLASDDGPDACHSSRFLCVMDNDEAVLDRETGLVWERAHSLTTVTWVLAAGNGCGQRETGGRRGWRLPAWQEFMTLTAPGVLGPSLPAVHPFASVDAAFSYWTATTAPNVGEAAIAIPLDAPAGAFSVLKTSATTQYQWCVRGPGGHDVFEHP